MIKRHLSWFMHHRLCYERVFCKYISTLERTICLVHGITAAHVITSYAIGIKLKNYRVYSAFNQMDIQ